MVNNNNTNRKTLLSFASAKDDIAVDESYVNFTGYNSKIAFFATFSCFKVFSNFRRTKLDAESNFKLN